MIRENQKKTLSEWNALVRTALAEIDDEIRDASVSEQNAVLTFEQYMLRLQSMGESKGFSPERVVQKATEIVGKSKAS